VTHLTSATLAAWALVTFRQPAPRKSLPPLMDTSNGGDGEHFRDLDEIPF
jgi:hypothetical protein